ncbi:MAG: class I SAM-dependent methyltransferase [Clostridia bacterium]|nr:class I SAM-dependent methyltransferase [Clostridia bacterium]
MSRPFPLNSLGLTHQFMAAHVEEGAFCIDATAGRGRDTAFLCRLVGERGRVLALDIQPEAVASTDALLQQEGLRDRAEVVLACHSRLGEYAAPATVDGIMFNFGWLPGGDHTAFSQPETSIAALDCALTRLRVGGVMTLCIYYGRDNGTAERDAILAWLSTVDNRRYTVIRADFTNRTGDVPIPVFIIREQ